MGKGMGAGRRGKKPAQNVIGSSFSPEALLKELKTNSERKEGVLIPAKCRAKKRYRTGDDAETALVNISLYGFTEVRPTRTYHCPDCGWWHLTKIVEWED